MFEEDCTVINFVEGLRIKYKTLRTLMLDKTSYPTFVDQFVNALKGHNMREEDREKDHVDQTHNMQCFFSIGRGHFFRGRRHVKPCQTCGRNIHTFFPTSIGEITPTNLNRKLPHKGSLC